MDGQSGARLLCIYQGIEVFDVTICLPSFGSSCEALVKLSKAPSRSFNAICACSSPRGVKSVRSIKGAWAMLKIIESNVWSLTDTPPQILFDQSCFSHSWMLLHNTLQWKGITTTKSLLYGSTHSRLRADYSHLPLAEKGFDIFNTTLHGILTVCKCTLGIT